MPIEHIKVGSRLLFYLSSGTGDRDQFGRSGTGARAQFRRSAWFDIALLTKICYNAQHKSILLLCSSEAPVTSESLQNCFEFEVLFLCLHKRKQKKQ